MIFRFDILQSDFTKKKFGTFLWILEHCVLCDDNIVEVVVVVGFK